MNMFEKVKARSGGMGGGSLIYPENHLPKGKRLRIIRSGAGGQLGLKIDEQTAEIQESLRAKLPEKSSETGLRILYINPDEAVLVKRSDYDLVLPIDQKPDDKEEAGK